MKYVISCYYLSKTLYRTGPASKGYWSNKFRNAKVYDTLFDVELEKSKFNKLLPTVRIDEYTDDEYMVKNIMDD